MPNQLIDDQFGGYTPTDGEDLQRLREEQRKQREEDDWLRKWRQHQEDSANKGDDASQGNGAGGGQPALPESQPQFKPPTPPVNPGDSGNPGNGGWRWNPNLPVYPAGYDSAPFQPPIESEPDLGWHLKNLFTNIWNIARYNVPRDIGGAVFGKPGSGSPLENPALTNWGKRVNEFWYGDKYPSQPSKFAVPNLGGMPKAAQDAMGASPQVPTGSPQEKTNDGLPDYSVPPGSYSPPGAPAPKESPNVPPGDQVDPKIAAAVMFGLNGGLNPSNPYLKNMTPQTFGAMVQPQVDAVQKTYGVTPDKAKAFVEAQYGWQAENGEFPQGKDLDALREKLGMSNGTKDSGARNSSGGSGDGLPEHNESAGYYANPYPVGSEPWTRRQIEVDRRIHQSHGGGGGGGGGGVGNFAPATPPPSTTSPSPTTPFNPAAYQNDQGVLKFDSRDWGTVSEKSRPYIDAILRENGWSPSGQYGQYGATEYKFSGTTPPQNIWFSDSVLSKLPQDIANEIRKLFAAKGWMITA